ncbi:MAG: bifunctional adenosylcobinamide kinase/adenosylcobinamide-phosphate guanylyltransferase [Clostridia bacterium]|nr:bifunctional adenosylcobinamide kinase/adenosylcobinamide-phosphate guanylyltransferase [Clostridia bacterium]
MILIIGGCYQGKLGFAKERYGLSEADIFTCGYDTDAIDRSKRCIAYIERFALNCVRAGEEPLQALRTDALRPDAVVIATDISGGVVPVDAELRSWREACGRMNNDLAARADEVWRLFCGIGQRLK